MRTLLKKHVLTTVGPLNGPLAGVFPIGYMTIALGTARTRDSIISNFVGAISCRKSVPKSTNQRIDMKNAATRSF